MKTMGDNLDPEGDVEPKADFELNGHRKPEITSKIMGGATKLPQNQLQKSQFQPLCLFMKRLEQYRLILTLIVRVLMKHQMRW